MVGSCVVTTCRVGSVSGVGVGSGMVGSCVVTSGGVGSVSMGVVSGIVGGCVVAISNNSRRI